MAEGVRFTRAVVALALRAALRAVLIAFLAINRTGLIYP